MPIFIVIFIILWAWLEITIFVAIGAEIGVMLTIIGVFVTAMVGIWLLRNQARSVMASLQTQISRGQAPLASMASGVAILVGAVLMLIPGYVTDAAGLILFIPVIRTILGVSLVKLVMKISKSKFGAGGFGPQFGTGEFGRGFKGGFGGAKPADAKDDFADEDESPQDSRRRRSKRAGPMGSFQDDDVIEGDFEEKTPDQQALDDK